METSRSSSGVQTVLTLLAERRVPTRVVHQGLWSVVWHRGYDDIGMVRHGPQEHYNGLVVYQRGFQDVDTALIVLETHEHLAAFVTTFAEAEPLLGKTGAFVHVKVNVSEPRVEFKIKAALGLGLVIDFEEGENATIPTSDGSWIDSIREALAGIRSAEVAHREFVETKRRALPYVEKVQGFNEEMKSLQEKIRRNAEAESDYTISDRIAIEKARVKQADPRKRNDGLQEERRIILARQARFDQLIRERIGGIRGRIPEIRDEYNKRRDAYADYLVNLRLLEESRRESRAASEKTVTMLQKLDHIAQAGLRVRGFKMPTTPSHRVVLEEINTTVELLTRAIPTHRLRVITRESQLQRPL